MSCCSTTFLLGVKQYPQASPFLRNEIDKKVIKSTHLFGLTCSDADLAPSLAGQEGAEGIALQLLEEPARPAGCLRIDPPAVGRGNNHLREYLQLMSFSSRFYFREIVGNPVKGKKERLEGRKMEGREATMVEGRRK